MTSSELQVKDLDGGVVARTADRIAGAGP